MRIIHHTGMRATAASRAAYAEAGLELDSGARSAGIVSFQMAEDDPRWPAVARLNGTWGITDFVFTRFEPAERDAAKFLGMLATGHRGYPEPSDHFGYLQATFDLRDYCATCGMGAKQAAPFRMKKAPSLGKRSVLQLNWVPDEFFVTPEVWASTFRDLGIGFREVLLDQTGAVIDSVVQLEIPCMVDVRLDGAEVHMCRQCRREKFRYSLRGFYPGPADTGPVAFKSSQSFGSGRAAFRLILVSQALYQSVCRTGLRGVEFYPCG